MNFHAIHRYAPMSARKARPVANLVKGLGANEALEVLEYEPKRAASFLGRASAFLGKPYRVEQLDRLVRALVTSVRDAKASPGAVGVKKVAVSNCAFTRPSLQGTPVRG